MNSGLKLSFDIFSVLMCNVKLYIFFIMEIECNTEIISINKVMTYLSNNYCGYVLELRIHKLDNVLELGDSSSIFKPCLRNFCSDLEKFSVLSIFSV